MLDLLLGEARRWHPLVGFGKLAQWLERRLNGGGLRIARGAAGVDAGRAAADAAAPGWRAARRGRRWRVHALLLYFCIGLRSLRDHTLPIARCAGARRPARTRAG